MGVLYDKESGTVLGRGCRSWSELGLYYILYYACLIAFFSATLAFLKSNDNVDFPLLQGSDSLLKGNPGMGYYPSPHLTSTLVFVDKGRQEYINHIREALAKYKANVTENRIDCKLSETRPGSHEACNVDFAALTKDCNEGNLYGFLEQKPCILLKLNRIYGWTPEMWSKKEVLRSEKVPDGIKGRYTTDRIWVYCFGQTPADNDNIGLNHISYYPQQGFPLGYFPYLKQKNYLSPLIFVKFHQPMHRLAHMLECDALAKNIEVNPTVQEGSVHFELYMK